MVPTLVLVTFPYHWFSTVILTWKNICIKKNYFMHMTLASMLCLSHICYLELCHS